MTAGSGRVQALSPDGSGPDLALVPSLGPSFLSNWEVSPPCRAAGPISHKPASIRVCSRHPHDRCWRGWQQTEPWGVGAGGLSADSDSRGGREKVSSHREHEVASERPQEGLCNPRLTWVPESRDLKGERHY